MVLIEIEMFIALKAFNKRGFTKKMCGHRSCLSIFNKYDVIYNFISMKRRIDEFNF